MVVSDSNYWFDGHKVEGEVFKTTEVRLDIENYPFKINAGNQDQHGVGGEIVTKIYPKTGSGDFYETGRAVFGNRVEGISYTRDPDNKSWERHCSNEGCKNELVRARLPEWLQQGSLNYVDPYFFQVIINSGGIFSTVDRP